MKNKPIRHKESNTFQFKTFSERVSEIDVDVFHRVAHRNEEDNEEVETYFHQTLQKWNFLNLTEGYCIFKKKLRDIVTLPQLINQKQLVIDTLIEYLEMKDVLFLQPILELVVAVSKDLQKDFYEYFPRFLSVIINLLQTKDTEQIEYTFTSLAYLFKFLWRYLVKNVKTVFDLLLPLLADTQPVYVNSFAAESFAFVVRKVKDKDSFLKTLLLILEDNPNTVQGCGKLLFEVISGTPGQFHSCAEQMLSLYFSALNIESVNQNLTFKILKEIVNCFVQNIHPQNCKVFWSVMLNILDVFIEKTKKFQPAAEREKSLILVMQLLCIVINYKNGKLVVDPVPLIKKLTQTIDIFEDDSDVLQEVINAAVAILLAANIKLMQETSSQILIKIMTMKDVKLLHQAVESLMHYSAFETLILPQVIRHCIATNINNDSLQLFTKIVIAKAPLCINGINLNKWKKYVLDIRGAKPDSINFFLKELKAISDINIPNNVLKILIILPHMKPLPEEFKDILKEGISFLYKQILNNANTESNTSKLCFTFLLALESAIHILEPENLHEFMTTHNIRILDLITKYPEDRLILNTVDLCITFFSTSQQREMYINQIVFDNLNNSIAHKLSSPYSEIRLIVTHLYSLFSNVKEIALSDKNTGESVMELMYLAECISVTVQSYRDRLLHLQSLVFEGNAVSCLHSKYSELPLRYLIGNLYVNFSLLWEPISKIIATYAVKECEIFWPIFLTELKYNHKLTIDHAPLYECDIISKIEVAIQKVNDKPDYENHKILLWKCMAHFTHFCEMKNRDITGLFIDYVNNNFFKSDSEDAKCCSILKPQEVNISDNAIEIDVQHDSNNESEENEMDEKEEKETIFSTEMNLKQMFMSSRSYKTKLLIAQLEIFEKVTNPKTLYRESEMQKIYLDLLSSKSPDIQKAALNCLLTYKHKYLLPYKDNLCNMINEKNLKNELTHFKIDSESNMIQNEHRNEFIPILMRLIYAKMVSKTGMRTGGKVGGNMKRKMILRFLAGTEENEMIIFTEMAFKPFKKYISLELDEKINLKQLTHNIINTVDLNNVIPPKRLQSATNLLAILIEQFGSKMAHKLLPYLLGLVICILAEVTGILQKSDKVFVGYLQSIKSVRTSCILILARFFGHFENYAWSEYEIDALFNVAVFPWLEKLPVEGIHSPTPLLKLFMAWSQNSRYYSLFIKYREDNKSISPLPYIMQLLLGPKTHASVVNAILEMIEKMVILQDYGKTNENDMEIDTSFIPLTPIVTNLLEINKEVSSNDINYGSIILLPHVFSILEYIKKKLEKSNRGVNKTELVILSRISEFVKDADACDTLLTLILPILVKRAAIGDAEETTIELLTTVINLIKHIRKPEIHMRAILPLLSMISAIPVRKLFLELYKTIAETSTEGYRETLVQNYDLITALNAWDRRWLDQPDFQKRLDAFTVINNAIEKDEITLEFGIAIIYNCYYFLKNETDLAMRDYAGQCLKLIGPKLAKKYKENILDRRYLMDDTILVLIRKGIVSKNEVVRFQSIGFLGCMAMECPEVHPILQDLSLLTNKVDPEVDFFENMQHLQMHRRARALLKFCNIAMTLKKMPNPKTLTQFILPLASSYLCNEIYIHKNSIVDAAIETVGTVCRLLPWYQYEIILKHYLRKLKSSVEFQKQLVRIIVIILDSFHFNLSKYKSVEEFSELGNAKTAKENEVVYDKKEKEENKYNEKNIDENIHQEVEEKLDEVLNFETVENAEEVVATVQKEADEDVLVMEKQTVLSQNGAQRVVFCISKELLPQLHCSIIARTKHERSHKINKKKISLENEEEELMRVPIALAFVKLLQKLPEYILSINLPGIFMKLCTFLKSRLESVRRVTREVLQKIMITLGPKYLHYLLREMNTLLTKGFQVHVLAFTVQSVLVALKPYFQIKDINENLQSILSVCKIDLFGLTAEEKEVMGIVKNVVEAKSTKSFDIFHILAQYITESCLVDLILPLKEVLMRTHSHKTVQKVVECLRNIVLGLADNTFIPMEQMLIFLYGVTSESIPELIPKREEKQFTEKEAKAFARQKPDSFIIPPQPKNRMGIKVASKTSKNTNVHIIIEFGLKLFHILLKRDKISGADFKPFVDPFVPFMNECLKSQHIKLSTLALQCLNWLLKMDLSSIQETISDICSSIFSILHKYAAAGLSKGDNFDLVMASFKCMSVIVRDVKHYTISTNQLKVLIMYAEQDMHNSNKQATAFGLLKAIIARKMVFPEMYVVMNKVAALSITSELEHVRLQSRSVFYSYLMEYPLGKHLHKHISFYLTQLGYETQPGRLSALEMLHSIITGFPLKTLILKSGFIFIVASARLVNDEDPTCRKLCAKCIKEMITRIPYNNRNKLFDIVVEWLKDTKIMHRILAAQLCGIFVTVEKDTFECRLKEILPLLLRQFHAKFDDKDEPGRFVKLHTVETELQMQSNIKDPERMKDHHMFQVLQLLLKISANCTAFLKNEEYTEAIRLFAEYSQYLLAHPHMWVRLAASQMIGFILAALDVDKIIDILENPEKGEMETSYMYSEPTIVLKSLTLDLIAQLEPDMMFEDLADQAIKNLIFIARILKSIKTSNIEIVDQDDQVKEKDKSQLSLAWLVRRLRKAVNVEITQAPKSTIVRTAFFKWVAGAVVTIPMEYLNKILFNIMSPIAREMSSLEKTNIPLRRLAKEAAVMIKKRLGNEEYTRLLSRVQQKLDVKKAERRKSRTQQFITDPELAAKRKIARQQKKKEAKKRKLDTMKGKKKIPKKRPKKEVDLDII
ncbi:small subunit processome component 20 homolog [Ptiloglossa arizonensis]|uniref:small subunit processome component 20 homolog n=1 Tax=Ptiloglossa arizonensis TaxID=3350558 RepID=UPI003FA0D44D